VEFARMEEIWRISPTISGLLAFKMKSLRVLNSDCEGYHFYMNEGNLLWDSVPFLGSLSIHK